MGKCRGKKKISRKVKETLVLSLPDLANENIGCPVKFEFS